MKMNKPPMGTLPAKTYADSYILLNPKYPAELAFRILGMKPGSLKTPLMIKGKEEDFEDSPNLVFKTIHDKTKISNLYMSQPKGGD